MESDRSERAPSPVELEVQRIRTLIERSEFEAALAAAEALLIAVPQNRDVLYASAVCLRYLRRTDDALARLERLEGVHPNFSLLFQERGYCRVVNRDASGAIEAFSQAVRINPALASAWRTLEGLYRMNGQLANANHAADRVKELASLPPDIVTATALFSDGDLVAAERMVRAFLLRKGDHVEGMRLLARIGLALDVLDDTEVLLEAVLAAVPDYDAARYEYALALLRRHKHAAAIEQLARLLQREPANTAYRTTYATAHVGIGNHVKALELYRELIDEITDPVQCSELHLSVGHSLKALGQQSDAVGSYRNAAGVRPNFGDAYWSLANLKTYRFTDEDIRRMRLWASDASTSDEDRWHFCFALGKALEDQGEYPESFLFYERGNALKKTHCRYRPGQTERESRLQMQVCTSDLLARRQRDGYPDPAPIFIVGLPRSGSTLIEQILASHSRVEGTMELANIPRIVLELQGREFNVDNPRYPHVLAELKTADFRRLGHRYIDETRAYRTGKPHFIDKMPNNFRHIGLIRMMLPNAKIIDSRRQPMACCFGNFKQLFAGGQEFTYSLEDMGRFYRHYVALMDHWHAVLPGHVLQVDHENLVENTEPTIRQILEFCDLPFEPACVKFHETERRVHTASSEQVRRPINRDGIAQWRHYEPWLDPLKAALADLWIPNDVVFEPH